MICLRPFWANDILKTEKWLNEMSNQGLGLKKVNFLLGIFYFEKEEVSDKKYRIVYDKRFRGMVQEIPKNILESGYQVVHSARKFYVLTFTGNPDANPTYSTFLERNQKRAFVIGMIGLIATIFYFFFLMFFLMLLFLLLLADNVEITRTGADKIADIIGVVIFLAYIWCIYTWFKVRKTNKELVKLCGENITYKFTVPEEILKPKDEIKALKKQKLLIKKTRIAWAYAPDKIERWLEKMESKGFNLYRLSRFGNSFYFIKGEQRKMKYVVDNQKCALPEYFKINKDAGWKLIFRSITRSWAYIVWSHEVDENEIVFMCDEEENLKRSRRLFLFFGICYIPCILIYIGMIIGQILFMIKVEMPFDFVQVYMFLIFLLIILEFSYFTFQAAGYYLRMRKIYKSTGSIRV